MPTAAGAENGRMPNIGARLRAVRLARGSTIEDLALVTGLNKGSISRIENDATSPSSSTLWVLCSALDITVGSLFELPERNLVRRGDVRLAPTGASGLAEYLISPRRQPRLQLMHSFVEPGGSRGPDLYTVSCQVEVAYVLSGCLDITFATHTESVEAGSALTFAGREPHAWVNNGAETAEIIWVMVPAPWSTTDPEWQAESSGFKSDQDTVQIK